MSKPKSLRYERAIETGVEILRNALNKKENEIRNSLLELKENELQLKKRESNLAESLRVLEQEKKNNEYLRVVNAKTEKIFNSAIESLRLKEKKMIDSLDSIINEFKLEPSDPDENMDIVGKLELLRKYLRKIQRNESEFLEYTKKIQAEKFGKSTGRCKCGYPVFIINGEVVAGSSVFGSNFDGDPEIVELEFKSMELDWERRALEHTREALRQEKLKQEEILQSREEKIRYKSEELETRLREVKRMEHILNLRALEREKNVSTGNNLHSNPSSASSNRRGRNGSRTGRNSCPVRVQKESQNHLGVNYDSGIGSNFDKNRKKQQKEEECGFNSFNDNSITINRANDGCDRSRDLNNNYGSGSGSRSFSQMEALKTEQARVKSSETPPSEEYELYSLSQSDNEILFTSPGYKLSPSRTTRRRFIGKITGSDESTSKKEVNSLDNAGKVTNDINFSHETIKNNFSDFNMGNNSSLEVTPNDLRGKSFNDSSERLIPPRMSPLLRSQRQRLKQILQEENEDNDENYARNSLGTDYKTSSSADVDYETFEINNSYKLMYSTPK
ncbi:uncharacterized protein cubi_02232 [Cryptosporidium ubiquitum]|uniref:Uncharacterized protein n=1 Tax=Cryptosporidium ubiquitum TaxID=857276 RepID=A0A1J4MFM2_9CRYT|nr:uncharacterized protein cubi_02232 [Cryptosporidium ubiquitum]OII73001.1 hypothetical protein cubi_02232 [Cryptosporidium ubiquitum]